MNDITKALKEASKRIKAETKRSKERRKEVRRLIDKLENCPLSEAVKIKN